MDYFNKENYRWILNSKPYLLIEEADKAVREGWIPLGPPKQLGKFLIFRGTYCQVMYRPVENIKN